MIFRDWLLSLSRVFRGLSLLSRVSALQSFSQPSNTPLNGYMYHILCIYPPFVDIRVVSALCSQCCCEHSCARFLYRRDSVSLGNTATRGIAGSCGDCECLRPARLFDKAVPQFTFQKQCACVPIPPRACQHFLFPNCQIMATLVTMKWHLVALVCVFLW